MFRTFNPLLIVVAVILLFYTMSFIFIPAVVLVIVVGGALGFAAKSGLWFITGPKQLWTLIKSPAARANFALYHATANVLDGSGWLALNGSADQRQFFIEGCDDENAVYEAAALALNRLKNGEKSLVVYRDCGATKVFVNLAVTVAFLFLLLSAGQMGLVSLVLAALAAQVVGPMISPYLQSFFLGGSAVKSLQVVNATRQKRTVKALKGKFSSVQVGVAVATSSRHTIEAEILEDD